MTAPAGNRSARAPRVWRPAAPSTVTFVARFAGRDVHGELPVDGKVVIGRPFEASAASLAASAERVSTGSRQLDRLLCGPAFLDAGAHPHVRFRTDELIRVPTGWRAIGAFTIKGSVHTVVSEVEADIPAEAAREMRLKARWALDAAWITGRNLPMLDSRIRLSCSLKLVLDAPPPRADGPLGTAGTAAAPVRAHA